jgi:glycosyltransferase 2 family protein
MCCVAESESPSIELLSRGLVRKLGVAMVAVSIVSGAALFYVDAGALLANIRRVPGSTLTLATLLACANYAVRYVRWQYYLRVLGIAVPTGESVLVFLAGFAMSLTPAKMGEVLKSVMLRESRNVPLARSAPIVVAERLTDLCALLLLGGFGVLDVPGGFWVAASSPSWSPGPGCGNRWCASSHGSVK